MGLWDSHIRTIDPERFRANNQYLYTLGYPYAEQYAYCDTLLGGHWRHTEDGAFGCETAVINDTIVSRDLLDSIIEIDFIRRACPDLDLRHARLLDIGAGYGRLAHRFTTEFPESIVYCTDAIELSRRVCSAYLRHRHAPRGIVVAPQELHLLSGIVDLAVNVHSWSECTLDEIRFWLDWLQKEGVPRLFVLPHDGDAFGSWGLDGRGPSFRPDIEARGYRISAQWTGPECNPKTYYLFARD